MATEHEPSSQPTSSSALDVILEPATAITLAWVAAVVLVLHSDPLLATLVVLGAAGGFVAGLVGVGGAIVMIPMLIYVLPVLGTGRLTMHEVAGVTMVQVMAAAASGVAGHLRDGAVNRSVAMRLAVAMVTGSFGGALVSRWLSAALLQGIFACMALGGAILMIAFRHPPERSGGAGRPARHALGFALALGVGLLGGAVGAGGAFLVMLIMLYILGMPTRHAVGTSLAITLFAASGGVLGKLLTGQIPGWPALALVAGALPGGQLGAAVSRRLSAQHLRTLLAILIAAVAIKMWWDILR